MIDRVSRGPNRRIKLTDSPMEVMTKMSEGNPGALQTLFLLFSEADGLPYVLALDAIGIYGSRLYMLWNDCCNRDIGKVKKILYRWARDEIKSEEILAHVSGGCGTPFEGLDDG